MRDRVRELLGRCCASIVAGLAIAGHGQWGFPWSPLDDGDASPAPGELSWADFERELGALLDGASGVGDDSRPSSERMP
jgi:hypothetical protein